MRRICFFLVAITCSHFQVVAEVLVTEELQHYLIAPESEQDIKQQLRNQSPISKNNQTFHGGTRWQLDPYFRVYKSGNLCRIIQVSVRLHTTYTLPKLDQRASITDATQTRFEDYYSALMEHEKGHHAIGLEAANTVQQMLEQHAPHYDCEQLKRSVMKRTEEIINTYKQRNRLYDQQTGYGRSQGAVIR